MVYVILLNGLSRMNHKNKTSKGGDSSANNLENRLTHEATLKLDWNEERGGQIHLDGEMDFPRDLPMEEVLETLSKRAEQVGGLVSSNTTDDLVQIKVSCQYGELLYILEAEDPSQPVQQITSRIVSESQEVTRTIEELEQMGQKALEVKEAFENGDVEWTIEKSNEKKNIMDM